MRRIRIALWLADWRELQLDLPVGFASSVRLLLRRRRHTRQTARLDS